MIPVLKLHVPQVSLRFTPIEIHFSSAKDLIILISANLEGNCYRNNTALCYCKALLITVLLLLHLLASLLCCALLVNCQLPVPKLPPRKKTIAPPTPPTTTTTLTTTTCLTHRTVINQPTKDLPKPKDPRIQGIRVLLPKVTIHQPPVANHLPKPKKRSNEDRQHQD